MEYKSHCALWRAVNEASSADFQYGLHVERNTTVVDTVLNDETHGTVSTIPSL